MSLKFFFFKLALKINGKPLKDVFSYLVFWQKQLKKLKKGNKISKLLNTNPKKTKVCMPIVWNCWIWDKQIEWKSIRMSSICPLDKKKTDLLLYCKTKKWVQHDLFFHRSHQITKRYGFYWLQVSIKRQK